MKRNKIGQKRKTKGDEEEDADEGNRRNNKEEKGEREVGKSPRKAGNT